VSTALTWPVGGGVGGHCACSQGHSACAQTEGSSVNPHHASPNGSHEDLLLDTGGWRASKTNGCRENGWRQHGWRETHSAFLGRD
jgi:hypothetical protein